jgi:hypothetical protein
MCSGKRYSTYLIYSEPYKRSEGVGAGRVPRPRSVWTATIMDCEKVEGEIVNVGSEEEVTLEELGRRVVALANSSSAIHLAGFRPHTPLDAFLREVIEYRRVISE